MYYGNRKDGDKFMGDWNNNGKMLWSQIPPDQVKDLYKYVRFLSSSLYCGSISARFLFRDDPQVPVRFQEIII